MLCTLVDEAPRGDEWSFETKWDGERCVVFVRAARGAADVRLQSRLLKDQTARYPELVDDLARVAAKSAIIDGEIVALDREGKASFETLQERFGLTDPEEIAKRMRRAPASFAAFDLLWLDGKDLRGEPLARRRKLLCKAIARCRRVAFSADVGDARALMKAVRRFGGEGIVAKRRASPYREGERGRDWLKIKVTSSQEVVVGGWTEGTGRRASSFGALVVGVFERGKGGKTFVPVGAVGTGFDDRTLAGLLVRLRTLRTERCPFRPAPPLSGVHWVRPKLVVQVRFANWTSGGQLRVPVFMGIRDDKRPEDCVRERLRKTRR